MKAGNAESTAGLPQRQNERPRRLINVALALVILSFLLFLCQILNITAYPANARGIDRLPLSIRAESEADYSQDPRERVIPPIDEKILDQIITDIPGTGSPQERMVALQAALSSPVPTMTPDLRIPATPTPTLPPPTSTPITVLPTSTVSTNPTVPPNTATRSVTPTQKVVYTYAPYFPPAATSTKTPKPKNTATGAALDTGTPTGTFTATVTLTPSQTPTFSPTASPTNTLTQTLTITPTRTPTVTASVTQTFTPTVTPTFTQSPTLTATTTPSPTSTSTPTYTPTDTPTFTPTATLTFTPTDTPTFTPSPTLTFTPTSTSTYTPTFTPSPTLTFTPTNTQTFTPTATLTFTPAYTPTDTPTLTPTYTPTNTATFTPSPTLTSTPTDTPTLTFTPTYTPTDTPTFTPSPTLTFTPTYTPTDTPTFTPTAILTSTPTSTPTDTPTATATVFNLAPLPGADFAKTWFGSANGFAFPVLNNDSEPEGDTLTVSSVGSVTCIAPINCSTNLVPQSPGSVSLIGNLAQYTPPVKTANHPATMTVQFTYQVCDSAPLCATGAVTVVVTSDENEFGSLVLNEILWAGSAPGSTGDEYVELKNTDPVYWINLKNLFLTFDNWGNSKQFTTLGLAFPGEIILLERMESATNATADFVYSMPLNNSGERIRIQDPGAVGDITVADFTGGWLAGTGVNISQSRNALGGWCVSNAGGSHTSSSGTFIQGSPGDENTCQVTATSTPVPTQTPTYTPTFTPSPTLTFTPTYTPTDTLTITPSPTLTFTPTFTPTDTPTFTPSPTLTLTPTYTPTDTPTITPSPTLTLTPTYTPTIALSPTNTSTPTPTFTNTPTFTPTQTPVPTATSTLPAITISNKSLFEKNSGNATFQFVVSLSKVPSSTVFFDYTTVNGSATNGGTCGGSVDYRSNSGTVSIVPPATTININITVCADTLQEPDETFTVVISNPVNAVISDGTGLGTIFDDDSPGFTSGDFVKSITPPDLSTNVGIATTIVIEFNRPMCESTILDPTHTRVYPISGADISATRSYNPSTWTLTITPDSLLSPSTEYKVMVRFTNTTVDGCVFTPSTHSETFTTSP